MKILVTGSSGFVGSRLVKELRKRGYEVIEFDRSNGMDVTDFNAVKRAVKGIDVIYHLAAVLDETQKKLMQEVNVEGTRNLLEAASKTRCRQFIYLSSVGVMGNIVEGANEETEIRPATFYEKSKAAAEQLVWDYQEMLTITVVRSAFVLGPNKFWESIVKLVGKGFPIPGSGKNRWQIIYVEDLVSALLFVLNNAECFGERFIVAEEKAHTLADLCGMIQQQLGMKIRTKTIPAWFAMLMAYLFLLKMKLGGKKSVVIPAHIKRMLRYRCYDTSKINKLGWRAKFSTEQAAERTVNELRKP